MLGWEWVQAGESWPFDPALRRLLTCPPSSGPQRFQRTQPSRIPASGPASPLLRAGLPGAQARPAPLRPEFPALWRALSVGPAPAPPEEMTGSAVPFNFMATHGPGD